MQGWAARDVVTYLTEWLTGLLASGGVDLPPQRTDDLPTAWAHHASSVQAILDDPDQARQPFRHPHLPDQHLAATIDQFYTSDVFMHTWDLGRAAGIAVELEDEFAQALLAGMREIEGMLRGSGQFGPAVAVPEGASPTIELMGFIGRIRLISVHKTR